MLVEILLGPDIDGEVPSDTYSNLGKCLECFLWVPGEEVGNSKLIIGEQ